MTSLSQLKTACSNLSLRRRKAESKDKNGKPSSSTESLMAPTQSKELMTIRSVMETAKSTRTAQIPQPPTSQVSSVHSNTFPITKDLSTSSSQIDLNTAYESQGMAAVRVAESEIQAENYYFGFMPREDIEQMLVKNGDFCVRKTTIFSTGYVFVLSYRWNDEMKHLVIQEYLGETEVLYFFSKQRGFHSIKSLIRAHYEKREPLPGSNAIITHPIMRKPWMITHNQIKLEKELGRGHFGVVYKAQYKRFMKPTKEVAVKQLILQRGQVSKDQREKFIAESRIMRNLNHENIVRLYGVAMLDEPIMILMEYCPGGSLLTALRNHVAVKLAQQLSEQLRYAIDAVKGMAYLEANFVIHRDIAARNCLLGSTGHAKISDFGLTIVHPASGIVDIETSSAKLPTRWLAPETHYRLEFSHKSDVWSFGILLWEIFSNGQMPYTTMSNAEVRRYVLNERRIMAPPTNCPKAITNTMFSCWKYDASERPTFAELASYLDALKSQCNKNNILSILAS